MTGPEGAGRVREEDAFDVEAVRAWLADRGRELRGDIAVRQFRAGASNLTYSLQTAQDDLILRRPPGGRKAAGAHDMGREYRIQSALTEPFGLVPPMVALCEDQDVIGSPFYVMERVDGIVLGRDLPDELGLDRDGVRRLCLSALDTLIALHQVDTTRPDVAALGKGSGYVERQITGWSRRYRDARTPDVPDFEQVMEWLAARMPADVANTVIHNDFRLDNVILDREDPSRIVAVLDWEMATLGDPLMDLGGTLSYWVQADDEPTFLDNRRQPTHVPGMLTRDEVMAYYCEAMGFDPDEEQRRFYEIYGLFRFAVIAQQIYYRYYHRQTTNEAYALFGLAVPYFEQRCRRLMGA